MRRLQASELIPFPFINKDDELLNGRAAYFKPLGVYSSGRNKCRRLLGRKPTHVSATRKTTKTGKRAARKRTSPQSARGIARRTAAASVLPTGPVTLTEARALAIATTPAAAAGVVKPAPSPAEVGREREELERRQEEERRRRIREYTATLTIMKARGRERPGRGEPIADLRGRRLVVRLPGSHFSTAASSRLEKRLLAFRSSTSRRLATKCATCSVSRSASSSPSSSPDGCPAGGPWDAMLFSGGGNDIVDNPMALWIRDFDPCIAAGPADQPAALRRRARDRAGRL